jgi:hypothetical protein
MLCEYNGIHQMPNVFLDVFLGVKRINIIFITFTFHEKIVA